VKKNAEMLKEGTIGGPLARKRRIDCHIHDHGFKTAQIRRLGLFAFQHFSFSVFVSRFQHVSVSAFQFLPSTFSFSAF